MGKEAGTVNPAPNERLRVETTMSNLPAELLDHIVDLLHDTEDTLRDCCLVSKSWIPRTRKHLFAEISFHSEENLQSWKKAFPDPSTSPACYTKALSVNCLRVVTAADAEPGGWITSFSRVVHLGVGTLGFLLGCAAPFLPFHGFSPAVKSLYVNFTILSSSQTFDLIRSFPLLEDLTVITYHKVSTDDGGNSNGVLTAVRPSSSPVFTGFLDLSLRGAMKPIVDRLLSLPGGIHFRKLTLKWFHETDPLSTMALVEGCSHTLESLHWSYHLFGTPSQHPRLHLHQ